MRSESRHREGYDVVGEVGGSKQVARNALHGRVFDITSASTPLARHRRSSMAFLICDPASGLVENSQVKGRYSHQNLMEYNTEQCSWKTTNET